MYWNATKKGKCLLLHLNITLNTHWEKQCNLRWPVPSSPSSILLSSAFQSARERKTNSAHWIHATTSASSISLRNHSCKVIKFRLFLQAVAILAWSYWSLTLVCSEDQSGCVFKINAYLGNLLKLISLLSLGTKAKSITALFWKILVQPDSSFAVWPWGCSHGHLPLCSWQVGNTDLKNRCFEFPLQRKGCRELTCSVWDPESVCSQLQFYCGCRAEANRCIVLRETGPRFIWPCQRQDLLSRRLKRVSF